MRKERLPANVTSFIDKNGRRRYRWRKAGANPYSFREHPNSSAGREELAAHLAGALKSPTRFAHGSVAWLAARFTASASFLGRKGDAAQINSRAIIDKFVTDFGKDRVSNFRFDHIEAILLKAAKPRIENGRKRGGPSAANNLRGELIPMFDYAIKLGVITTNPVRLAVAPAVPKSTGFHCWTEEEIAQYRARHPLGSMARLAIEIFLWTVRRRGDASTFGRKHMRNGKIECTAAKNGKQTWLPIAPQLTDAIDAMQVTGTETFLVTAYGRPFSKAGLGNKMRQWCDEAELPQCSAHGLRKAATRRAAEHGGTNQGLKAMGGWSQDREVGTYTAAANQALLAEQAMAPVIAFDRPDLANLPKQGNRNDD